MSLLLLLELGDAGGQTMLSRPAQNEVIVIKFGAMPEVRVPAFSRSNEQHAVSGVLDDVAVVMKMKSEFLIRPRRLRKNDIQVVVAACAALLEIHAFILKKNEGNALLSNDAVNGQRPG